MSKSEFDIENVIIDLERADCLMQLAFEEVEEINYPNLKECSAEEAKTALLCYIKRSPILTALLDSIFFIIKQNLEILHKELDAQYAK